MMSIASCAPRPDEASAARELLALTKEYNAAWDRLDADAIMGFHPDDVHYYWYGSVIPSRAVFDKVLREEILPNTKS
jgi:hypothetical protein